MPSDMNSDVLRNLAKLGAQARLEQIELERRAILAAFPDLAGGRQRPGRRPGRRAESSSAAPRRRRRTMSAAERKEVSERMKRYWAERRKAKGK